MSISMTSNGNFNSTEKLLDSIIHRTYLKQLDRIAKQGVEELSRSTPVDTGKTSKSWYYTIKEGRNSTSIIWSNSNIDENGTPVVILIRHGHVSNNGVFIEGNDFISPAIQPIFESMAESVRKALI